MNDSAIGGVMVQTNKIIAALSKGFWLLWAFVLISITVFGLALTLATLNRWPQALIGLVIAVTPFIIWNIEKILTLACQMLRHALGFTFRTIHKTITLIHKRKWTALLFWITSFLWAKELSLVLLGLILFFKFSQGSRHLTETEREQSPKSLGEFLEEEELYSFDSDDDVSPDPLKSADEDLSSKYHDDNM